MLCHSLLSLLVFVSFPLWPKVLIIVMRAGVETCAAAEHFLIRCSDWARVVIWTLASCAASALMWMVVMHGLICGLFMVARLV